MIHDIVQRTDEWYSWRREGLTASQMSDILGYGYNTPWRIWALYLGKIDPEDLSKNPFVKQGVEMEDIVRQNYEERHQDVSVPVCTTWDKNPVFRASLDGLNGDGVPTEFKVINSKAFLNAINYGQTSLVYLTYWVQVQHQMLTVDADHAWLCLYSPNTELEDKYFEFKVERDDAFIEQELIPCGQKFWNINIQKKKAPIFDPKRDIYIPDGEQLNAWKKYTTEWEHLKHKINMLEEEQSEVIKEKLDVEEKLKELMGEFRQAYAYGLQMTRYKSAPRVNYKNLIDDLLPDLTVADFNRYKGKPGKEVIRITQKKPDPSIINMEARKREKIEMENKKQLEEAFPLANF